MKRIILASESPRRREILANTDINFTTKSVPTEEIIDTALPLSQAIEQVALQKAKAVQPLLPKEIILGADTIVCVNGEILGKPHTKENAIKMLQMLSGKTHEVITGVAILYKDTYELFHEISEVTFYPLTEEEILAYVDTKEPLDKAGAYAIQGKGAILVAKISGDYYNIVGLPIASVYRRLQKYIMD